MATVEKKSVTAVDGHYMHEERAAAYLVVDGDEAAFVDNITRFSIPHLMAALDTQGLAPEQVRYAIVTHIHLDHSGGTAELVKHCPNAQVLCHPRAGKHIIDPERLVSSARSVYGADEFDALYGVIEAVDKNRVTTMEDNASVDLGQRTLTFLDTPGHAGHHHAIYDSAENVVYAGDAFGTSYHQMQCGSKPFFNYVCAPPQFDPALAKKSIQRIVDTGCDTVYVTHYGGSNEIEAGAEQLCRALDSFDELATRAQHSDLDGEALLDYCRDGCREIIQSEMRASGLDADDPSLLDWATKEHNVTSQGVEVLAMKRRKEAAESA